nr:hypothetical protein [Tanacetum cinerariifolium]
TPPPPPTYRTTTRMSIRAQTPIPFLSEAKVNRLLVIPTLPSSPLMLLSSPLSHIPSPSFPIPSPPTTSPTYTEVPLGYREAEIQLRTASPPPLPLSSPLPLPLPIILPYTRASMVMMIAAAPSTYCLAPPSKTPPILPIPLPTSSPTLLLPSTDGRADVTEVTSTGGFRADYGFVGTLDAKIRRDPNREIGYEITDVWEDLDEIVEEIPGTDVVELEDELEDGPIDYLADGGDDDDDDNDSSRDDADDEDEEEAYEEDEKEHLALTNSTDLASPVVDHVPSTKRT